MTFTTRPIAAVMVLLVVAGCEKPADQPPSATSTSTITSTVAASTPPPVPLASPAPAPPDVDALRAEFDSFAAGLGQVGVTVVSGQSVWTFGPWTEGVAWSTIKVPLAIAAHRKDPDQAAASIHSAIEQSDNGAAENLWAMLGSAPEAAEVVQGVLREGGDDGTTTVPSTPQRDGFTIFGQTDWSTTAQARFAWKLPCIDGGQAVRHDMQHLAGNQAWGLAGDDGVLAKGGWGPDRIGSGYLVRQLATIASDTGSIGVALATDGGSFGSGTAIISQLAQWVRDHRQYFAPTPCSAGAPPPG